jgi:hypothetical protein
VLNEYVRREIAKLLASPGFIDALPGFLLPDAASQSRIGIVPRAAARSGIALTAVLR